VPQYLRCVVPHSGYLVLDDTQALGIWGQAPEPLNPYGRGGGGTLCLHNNRSPAVIIGSSLAKGLGVPLATLGGSAKLIRRFMRRSETRIHASPPSIAVLRAAEHALMLNAAQGDEVRRHLARLVTRFREQIYQTRLSGTQSLFPVQTLTADPSLDVMRLHRMLHTAGVRTVVVRERSARGAKLLFVFNALHSIEDVDRAADALTCASSSSLARRRILAKKNIDGCWDTRGPSRPELTSTTMINGSIVN
jgi:8-amino-7-oxononanoate synthase